VGPRADIIETTDSNAPLSSYRGASVGMIIRGDPADIASAMNLDCPFDPDASAGDHIARGFCVKNDRGTTIDLVKVLHATNADNVGSKTIVLVARLGSYDGPILGTAARLGPARRGGRQAQPGLAVREDRVLPRARGRRYLPVFWTPVFRMYNNGMTGAPNHRFTTDESIYVDFTTNRGWAPEGVRFCAPFII
jgi:hypothetical protein